MDNMKIHGAFNNPKIQGSNNYAMEMKLNQHQIKEKIIDLPT